MAANSPFGFDAPEESPGLLLWQTTTLWQRLIKKALEGYGVSHAQFVILAILLWFEEQGEPPTQVEIVRLSKLDKMTVSKSLKKLISQDLVKRSENQEDTRAKNVHLTTKGKILACELVPLVEQIDSAFFSKINAKDQNALISLFKQLVAQEDHKG